MVLLCATYVVDLINSQQGLVKHSDTLFKYMYIQKCSKNVDGHTII